MNTRLFKWLLTFTVICCFSLVATNVTAKKPVKPPPEPEPPVGSCETSEAFFPAFMFWRNTNTANNPENTIYLASEDGVCVRALVDVPDSRNALWWPSSFGYDKDHYYGYVVWAKGMHVGEESEIWLQEFTVEKDGNGNTINPPPDPERILDTDYSNTITYAPTLAISADLQYLAFNFHQGYNNDDSQPSEIHVIDIETCRSSYPLCMPSEDTLVLRESEGSFPDDFIANWGHIAWGPLDKRIYIQMFHGDHSGANQWGINMITLTGDSWTGGETIVERELFTDDYYPEYSGVFRISSGISGGREKLAFRHNGGDCYTISVIDVADCEAGPTKTNPRPCGEAEAQFSGTYPSWTDQGTILYEPAERGRQHKRTGAYSCNYSDFINEWNPGSSETTTLVEGENPDAG